ncbi:hypothetical protein CALVIDRAFT_151711 [Calocera viscosa TUFC12733]|uniref:Uncharacterized protein n=1 Tax=Calocera viscosa (strain TUFC12733) TaxID=1330018 RepID=A0A167LK99_CALVF|nr:hypothetical protein CALVIDRAFT_151711 [Calocera viscosa TUFC12733]
MSFVPRAIARSRPLVLRRSYSFLSNKHGRSWFTSGKAAAAKQQGQGQRPQVPSQQPGAVVGAEAQERDGVQITVDGLAEGKPVADVKPTGRAPTDPPTPTPDMSISIAHALTWPSPTLPPTDHPQPSLRSLTMQRFYSLDRPLLSVAVSPAPPATQPEEVDKEAEADAARLLARALVMTKLGAEKDWDDVVAQLEGREESVYDDVVNMDSVKRKRRKKMTKHNYNVPSVCGWANRRAFMPDLGLSDYYSALSSPSSCAP